MTYKVIEVRRANDQVAFVLQDATDDSPNADTFAVWVRASDVSQLTPANVDIFLRHQVQQRVEKLKQTAQKEKEYETKLQSVVDDLKKAFKGKVFSDE